MFRPGDPRLVQTVSRRRFLEQGGGLIAGLGVGSAIVGLGSSITCRPVYAQSSEAAKWRQFEGSKLVFMSENTPPSFAISDNLKAFYDLTGMEVEILTDDLPVVQQKVASTCAAGPAAST